MAVYPPSSWRATSVPVEAGGCGVAHIRPYVDGIAQHPWALICNDGCEDFLRTTFADQVSPTVAEIKETYDETKIRENFDKRGARDKDAIMALALAKIAGIENLPDSLTRMVSGAPLHVPGQMECPSGHAQPSGQKFCGECGAAMHGAPAAAAIAPVQKAAEPPVAGVDMPSSGRIKDANKKSLQALCRAHGLDEDGTNSELVVRLSNAGLTINDLAKLASQPVAA